MAVTRKILGQAAPAAATPANIYTVPALTSTVVSTLVICNRGAATTFRFSARQAGAVQANLHYNAYDTPLEANETVPLTFGGTLAATDVITVQSASGNVSFTLYGEEHS